MLAASLGMCGHSGCAARLAKVAVVYLVRSDRESRKSHEVRCCCSQEHMDRPHCPLRRCNPVPHDGALRTALPDTGHCSGITDVQKLPAATMPSPGGSDFCCGRSRCSAALLQFSTPSSTWLTTFMQCAALLTRLHAIMPLPRQPPWYCASSLCAQVANIFRSVSR